MPLFGARDTQGKSKVKEEHKDERMKDNNKTYKSKTKEGKLCLMRKSDRSKPKKQPQIWKKVPKRKETSSNDRSLKRKGRSANEDLSPDRQTLSSESSSSEEMESPDTSEPIPDNASSSPTDEDCAPQSDNKDQDPAFSVSDSKQGFESGEQEDHQPEAQEEHKEEEKHKEKGEEQGAHEKLGADDNRPPTPDPVQPDDDHKSGQLVLDRPVDEPQTEHINPGE